MDITIQKGAIIAFDGTGALGTRPVIPIKYTDLIGQPGWIEADTLTVMTIMRSDITVGNNIRMPEELSMRAGTPPGACERAADNEERVFELRPDL